MAPLALPLAELRSSYETVVVGSGYGGAIVAARLAEARLPVCVLERGREFEPGQFPDGLGAIVRELQVDRPGHPSWARDALYDLRLNDDVNVFVGCGLGGTSLINANVAMWPDQRVFEQPGWPPELQDRHNRSGAAARRRVETMLEPQPCPPPSPLKLKALERAAAGLGPAYPQARATPARLAVRFRDGSNAVGVHQNACRRCGDCVSGCNYAAKNTMAMNYLPYARRHGATMFTGVAVRRVEPRDGRWLVHFELVDRGRPMFDRREMALWADRVVLAAGALGSTEILLRSAPSLALSPRLGQGFSGNGDVLAFAYNADQPVNGIGAGRGAPDADDGVGPCITGVIDLRSDPRLEQGTVIQEGSIPGGVSALLPAAFAIAALFGGGSRDHAPGSLGRDARHVWRALRPDRNGALRHTQTFLVMAHDAGAGCMALDGNDRLRVHWDRAAAQPIFETVHRLLRRAGRALGGAPIMSPFGLTTVHPLGGCRMATSVDGGVVDHRGRVFRRGDSRFHEGLYVCDGAVIPGSLGVNPFVTIAVVAELIAEHLVAEIKNPRGGDR